MDAKKLPIIYQFYGYITRNIFDFRWKSRITNPLLDFIKKITQSNRYYCYVRYVDGIKIRLDLRDWIPQLIFVWGDYTIERSATTYFRSILKPGMIFIDIGANIGYYTLIASKVLGNTGRIFAFEPVSRNIAILEENININKFSNITVIQKALSNEENQAVKIYLPTDDMCGMGSLRQLNDVNYSGEFEIINTTTFENFLNSYGVSKVDVIKIDVEGNELNVLKGMENIFSNDNFNPILLIELTEWSLAKFTATIKDLIDYLSKYNFTAYKINPDSTLTRKTDYSEEFLCVFKR